MAGQPALEYLLGYDNLPDECSSCPFGQAQMDPYPPNPADPGEGYYRCDLLALPDVWGEDPTCQMADWRARAKDELRELLGS